MHPHLANLIAATKAGSFVYHDPAEIADLISAGLAEQNPQIVNPENPSQIATRATEAGMNVEITAPTDPAPATPAPVVTATAPAPASAHAPQSFARSAFTPPPKGTRTRREGAEKYPFADLRAPTEMQPGTYDAFFVAKTDAVPDPNKTLTSACSAANRRYATDTGRTQMRGNRVTKVYDYSRKFEVFDGTDAAGAVGVWVARTM